jgi:hypothetical protein
MYFAHYESSRRLAWRKAGRCMHSLVQISDLFTCLRSLRVNSDLHMAKCKRRPWFQKTHLEDFCPMLAFFKTCVSHLLTMEVRGSNDLGPLNPQTQGMLHDCASQPRSITGVRTLSKFVDDK